MIINTSGVKDNELLTLSCLNSNAIAALWNRNQINVPLSWAEN